MNRHQRLVESFHERLRGKGIALSTEELAGVVGIMREEICHRHIIARKRINHFRRMNEIKENLSSGTSEVCSGSEGATIQPGTEVPR